MKKVSKKALSLLLALAMLCGIVMVVPVTASAAAENLALSATATADSSETSSYGAENANDGSTSTRWASDTSGSTHWVQYYFTAPVTVSSAYIFWERNNVYDYEVQYSSDGSTWASAYTYSNSAPDTSSTAGREHTFDLNSEITAQYFRVYITNFTPTAADSSGTSVTWNTVSIYEFALYGESVGELPRTLSQVAASLTAPVVADGDEVLTLPAVPDGFTIEFNGADYSAIIDDEGNIRRPLNDQDVKVSFIISDGNESLTTDDYTVTVPGTFTATETSNAKPVVIPELAEWAGADGGEFKIASAPKLIVDSSSYGALSDSEKAKYEDAIDGIIADFLEITGKKLTVTVGNVSAASAGDFVAVFGTDDVAQLGDEGYKLNIDDVLTVEANTETGFYWATRSILQILKQTGGTIAKGLSYDYPRYALRGFMLDVGRTPVSLETLEEIVKTMSWYKMNDFGVHLYDNFIWVENYDDARDLENGAYSGFRLESDVVEGGNEGKNQADLTSSDLYYTKDEFRSLITDSRALGVDVVPEFDAPAHSLSITKVRPDLSMTQGSVSRWADHLDLSNPESIEFVQDLWNEYITGSDPVFDEDTILNIGSDEYNGNQSDFTEFVFDMLEFAQNSGHTSRMWGSITTNDIPDSVDTSNTQVYLWNTGYADPQQLFDNGFNIIDILDGSNYIVPGANYYGDYLSASAKYASYDPATELGLPSSDSRVLGGSYAIWNDYVGDYLNGITDYDIFDRFYAPLIGYASQLWGDAEDMSYSEIETYANVIDTAPGTNPYYEVESQTDDKLAYDFTSDSITDTTGNGYDATGVVNAEVVTTDDGVNALKLNGGASYVSTPIDFFGADSELSFSVYQESANEAGAILFETSDNFEVWAINIQEDGTLGFSREKMNYSFNYTIPVGQWVDLKIVGHKDTADLYVNGELYSSVGSADRVAAASASANPHATLMIPFARIGSETSSFEGLISAVGVYQETVEEFSVLDPTIIDRSNFDVSSDNENPDVGGEGPVEYAFDGDTSTIWHTNYTNYAALPATITIDMQVVYEINKLTYIPRQSGSNGNVLTYTISVSEDGETWTDVVTDGTWSSSSDTKYAKFDSINARYVKFTALTGATDSSNQFASAAEIYIHQVLEEPVTEYTLGDVNNDGYVNAIDATFVLQYYADIITSDDLITDVADLDGNAKINSEDATLILQKYANIIEKFPIE